MIPQYTGTVSIAAAFLIVLLRSFGFEISDADSSAFVRALESLVPAILLAIGIFRHWHEKRTVKDLKSQLLVQRMQGDVQKVGAPLSQGKSFYMSPLSLMLLIGLVILSACAGTGTPIGDAQTRVYQIRSSYDAAFLAPAANYNRLPRCVQDGPPVCSDPKVVDQLRKADASAKALLDGAEDVVRNHPELDWQAAIDAAVKATQAATQILTVYGVH